MTTIHKFPLEVKDGEQSILVHLGSKVVHVNEQNGNPCLWIKVDLELPIHKISFVVIATGHQVPNFYEYVGTAHCPPFVWHVFRIV